MKIYFIQLKEAQLSAFISFSATYNISIYFTWMEDDGFFSKNFFVTCTDQPDPKITTEEKARLITEGWKVLKTQNL